MQIQFDRARNGQPALLDRRVRRAIYHGIDRVVLAQVVTHGLAPVADVPLSPTDAMYPRVEPSITRYPYDPSRALSLLQEAGWTQRGDSLVDGAGQPFSVEYRTVSGPDNEVEMGTIAAELSKLGMQVTQTVVPQSRMRDLEYRVAFPGLNRTDYPMGEPQGLDYLHSAQCPTAQKRFVGLSRGCWLNTEFDNGYAIANTALDPSERAAGWAQALRAATEDVGAIGLSYSVDPVAIRKGLVGYVGRQPGAGGDTWNIHEFRWE
jgi:peptide/nickel transport system substrate-binding protein